MALRFLAVLLTLLPGCAFAQSRFCIDRDTITFGDRPVGSSSTVTVTVSNCGSSPYTFTEVSVHPSTGPGYRVNAACATGTVLQAGQSCSATITFAPTSAGQQSGALWLRNTTNTPTQLITFYGRGTTTSAGTSTLSFSPSIVQFDDTQVGRTSTAVRLDLKNQGSVAIVPSALVLNGPGAYDFDGNGDCAVGRAIPAGGSCHLDMIFTPQDTGARIANLNVDAPQLSSLAILRLAGTGTAAAVDPTPAPVDIVEFHHASLDHYFLTADAAEVAFIEGGGLGSAWTRTGRRLRGWPAAVAVNGAVDACRFFGTPGAGPDSHFYTVDAAECGAVKKDPFWIYEGVAFRVLPLLSNGTCATGSAVVQRMLKSASNVAGIRHRHVIATSDIDAMRSAGWILEGPVFCSPPN